MIEEAAKGVEEAVKLVEHYGIIVFAVIFLFIIVYFVKRQMDNADRREDNNTKTQEQFVLSLQEISSNLKEHDVNSERFRVFVRQEHQEFMKTLSEITGILSRINNNKRN